jgi:hypothetical protein
MNNFVKIIFLLDRSEELNKESAWAIKVGDDFQLKNILFYAKNYSYDDIVSVKKDGDDYIVNSLVKEMGHSTVRVLVKNVSLIVELRKHLKNLGCDSEISNYEKLISIDIPPNINYKDVKLFLENGEYHGKWEYEEGCIASNHA